MAYPTSPPWRLLLRSVLALPGLVLSTSCGPDKPVEPPPPTVTVNVPQPNTIAPSLKVSVTVSGCEQVDTLTLLDNGQVVKNVPYAGGEALVDVAKNELRYSRGIAANLSFTARAVCSDGRQSESQPAAATFFPVESVLETTNGQQVVTDYFVAEGSGSSVAFLGCGNLSSGLSMLYRVDIFGDVKAQVQMPFVCTSGTVITEKHSDNTRWVWTPGAGVMAINSNTLAIVSSPVPQLKLNSLDVGPGGDALAQLDSGDIVRLSRAAGYPASNTFIQWTYSGAGSVIGTPVFRTSLGEVMLPLYSYASANAEGVVHIDTLSWASGPAPGGGPAGRLDVKFLYQAVAPAAAFNSDGNTLYLAFDAANDQSLVLSCPTNVGPCDGPNVRWQSAALQGRTLVLLPYAGGTRLAAVGPKHTWFLNPASQGAVVNKDGASLATSGALEARLVQQGLGTGQDFYLLSAAPGTLPMQEIVAVDRAENGELFRYQVPGGDVAMALDAAGRVWMRVNKKLVKLLPLTDYRLARQQ